MVDKSLLSSKQREELHLALAEYFKSQGLNETYEVFTREVGLQNNNSSSASKGALEKKWVAVVRLTLKNEELTKKLKDVSSDPYLPSRKKLDPSEWIPRPPEKVCLLGHRNVINSVNFHPIYQLVATGSDDAQIKLWDSESGELSGTLKGHTDSVQDVAFDPSGKTLASCSNDMSIKLWDISALQCTKTLQGHEHSIHSLCYTPSGMLVSASRDTCVKFWDLSSGYCHRTIRAHKEWVRCVKVSPDGQYIASCSDDKTVKVWLISTTECVNEFLGHDHVIECLEWAPETAFHSISVNLCHQNESDLVNIDSTATKKGKPSRFIISGSRDKSIRMWNIATGLCLCELRGHDDWIRGLKFHPGGKYILSVSDDKTLKIWDYKNQRIHKSLQAHDHFVSCLDCHHKNPFVLTGSVDYTAKIWECR